MTPPDLIQALRSMWTSWKPDSGQIDIWWFVFKQYKLDDIKMAIVEYGKNQDVYKKDGPQMNKFLEYLKIVIDAKPEIVKPMPCEFCLVMSTRKADIAGRVFCKSEHSEEYYKLEKKRFLESK